MLRILIIFVVSAEFTLIKANYNVIPGEKWDADFYRNCTLGVPTGSRIKCVGIPFGCIMTKNCAWMGSVTDDGGKLQPIYLSKSLNYDASRFVQFLSGGGLVTLDESMTKIECREPQIEDYKFVFIFNDTTLISHINRSHLTITPGTDLYLQSSNVLFTGRDIIKSTYLQNCTETNIPPSKNQKHIFNLPYFLHKYVQVGMRSFNWFMSDTRFEDNSDSIFYEVADSVDYIIDESKMLLYTNFTVASSTSSGCHGVINTFVAKIVILCLIVLYLRR